MNNDSHGAERGERALEEGEEEDRRTHSTWVSGARAITELGTEQVDIDSHDLCISVSPVAAHSRSGVCVCTCNVCVGVCRCITQLMSQPFRGVCVCVCVCNLCVGVCRCITQVKSVCMYVSVYVYMHPPPHVYYTSQVSGVQVCERECVIYV